METNPSILFIDVYFEKLQTKKPRRNIKVIFSHKVVVDSPQQWEPFN